MPVLRTITLGLIITGLSGAALYHLQSRRTAAPAHAPLAAASNSRSHIRSRAARDEAAFNRDAADFLSTLAAATAARAAPTRATTAQLQTGATEDDLDLNDPILRVPLARVALASVGIDEIADALWLHAINDPDVDAESRKGLIEDLNEDGFPDPKHPTRDDLALIEARLALIERLTPDPLDATNAAALAEAKKDLTAMRESIGRRAEGAPASPQTPP